MINELISRGTGTQNNVKPDTILALKGEPQGIEGKWVKLSAYSSELISIEEVCVLNIWINKISFVLAIFKEEGEHYVESVSSTLRECICLRVRGPK